MSPIVTLAASTTHRHASHYADTSICKHQVLSLYDHVYTHSIKSMAGLMQRQDRLQHFGGQLLHNMRLEQAS